MRILLAEGDSIASQSLQMTLKRAHLCTFTTNFGEETIDLAKLYEYDLILVNNQLPDMGGLELIRRLRRARIETPVLVLSDIEDLLSKIEAFGLGADDYLTQPIHREELVARIHAIVRRANGHAQSVVNTGKLSVNLTAKTVSLAGKLIHLTVKEYQMLELLSLRKGKTLAKETFLNHLYGGMDEPEPKIIDVFIYNLRKKLGAAGGSTYIDTVWGHGYVLRDCPEGSRNGQNNGSHPHSNGLAQPSDSQLAVF